MIRMSDSSGMTVAPEGLVTEMDADALQTREPTNLRKNRGSIDELPADSRRALQPIPGCAGLIHTHGGRRRVKSRSRFGNPHRNRPAMSPKSPPIESASSSAARLTACSAPN